MDSLQEMMGKGGGKGAGKGGGKGGPKQEAEDVEVEKDEDGYTWSQKGDEVQILFKLPKPATKKEIKVTFKMASLSVVVHGTSLLDGSLGGPVDTDDCTWCLANGGAELQVMLTKKSSKDNWTGLLK